MPGIQQNLNVRITSGRRRVGAGSQSMVHGHGESLRLYDII